MNLEYEVFTTLVGVNEIDSSFPITEHSEMHTRLLPEQYEYNLSNDTCASCTYTHVHLNIVMKSMLELYKYWSLYNYIAAAIRAENVLQDIWILYDIYLVATCKVTAQDFDWY